MKLNANLLTLVMGWSLSALMSAGIPVTLGVQQEPRKLGDADALFKEGKFAEAEKAYAQILAENSKNPDAALSLGMIALLGNRLDGAESMLKKAIEFRPDDRTAKSLLGEVFYRRDQLQESAPLFRSAGLDVKAAKLESFAGQVPYKIDGKADQTHIRFIQTDPLPVVRVRVNDSEEVHFIIDTGGSEVILDTEFARQVDAAQFGSVTSTYAGGRQAATQHGRIRSLTLGEFVIRDVPVHLLDTRRFSPVAGGRRVDGVIGTVLLYHFLPTLDYPNGELILRRKTPEALRELDKEIEREKPVVLPFWMAGDHFMVAWGSVNQKRVLLFIDTGLAGGGFTGPKSVVEEAGIRLLEDKGAEGIGGGGKVRVIPLVADEVALGEAKERNVPGVFGPFPPDLEYRLGFRIGGIISHVFFRNYRLTFDFSGMRCILKRKE